MPRANPAATLPDGKHLRLIVPKNPTATNLNDQVELFSDLSTPSWTNAPILVETESSTELRVRDRFPITSNSKRFTRLRVISN